MSVSVIVPVYGDWSSLKECINSLISNVDTTIGHKVMLINDCGPDADEIEKNVKLLIKGKKNFTYYRNKKNLGFVQNCNNAVLNLEGSKNDILLLNSDTETTEGFLEEMLEVLHCDERNAAVSPRSNNATICTIPLTSMRNKNVSKEESYEVFKRYAKKFPRYSSVPTAHGFCMLIKREAIDKFGLFDEVFGKGYGEEVDFCQRLINDGYSCVLSNHSYVFHHEAKSFSMEAKVKLLETNNKIIRSRYPHYKEAVTKYIDEALLNEEKILGSGENSSRLNLGNIIRNRVKHNRFARRVVRFIRKFIS